MRPPSASIARPESLGVIQRMDVERLRIVERLVVTPGYELFADRGRVPEVEPVAVFREKLIALTQHAVGVMVANDMQDAVDALRLRDVKIADVIRHDPHALDREIIELAGSLCPEERLQRGAAARIAGADEAAIATGCTPADRLGIQNRDRTAGTRQLQGGGGGRQIHRPRCRHRPQTRPAGHCARRGRSMCAVIAVYAGHHGPDREFRRRPSPVAAQKVRRSSAGLEPSRLWHGDARWPGTARCARAWRMPARSCVRQDRQGQFSSSTGPRGERAPSRRRPFALCDAPLHPLKRSGSRAGWRAGRSSASGWCSGAMVNTTSAPS